MLLASAATTFSVQNINAENSVGYAEISVGFAENSIGFAENSALFSAKPILFSANTTLISANPTLFSALMFWTLKVVVADAKSSTGTYSPFLHTSIIALFFSLLDHCALQSSYHACVIKKTQRKNRMMLWALFPALEIGVLLKPKRKGALPTYNDDLVL